jgi:hypothetical protein
MPRLPTADLQQTYSRLLLRRLPYSKDHSLFAGSFRFDSVIISRSQITDTVTEHYPFTIVRRFRREAVGHPSLDPSSSLSLCFLVNYY